MSDFDKHSTPEINLAAVIHHLSIDYRALTLTIKNCGWTANQPEGTLRLGHPL